MLVFYVNSFLTSFVFLDVCPKSLLKFFFSLWEKKRSGEIQVAIANTAELAPRVCWGFSGYTLYGDKSLSISLRIRCYLCTCYLHATGQQTQTGTLGSILKQ